MSRSCLITAAFESSLTLGNLFVGLSGKVYDCQSMFLSPEVLVDVVHVGFQLGELEDEVFFDRRKFGGRLVC